MGTAGHGRKLPPDLFSPGRKTAPLTCLFSKVIVLKTVSTAGVGFQFLLDFQVQS